ncbi:MAG: hypothetical protein GY724_15690 [Actinomycetia bacterium]|nr:hypothetical protein [Actinomycetes bacterium]
MTRSSVIKTIISVRQTMSDDGDYYEEVVEHTDGTWAEPDTSDWDADSEYLHLSIPELALAQTIATAGATGSPRVRRRARVASWILLLAFAAPVVINLLFSVSSLF